MLVYLLNTPLFPCLGTQLYVYTSDLLALASHINPTPQRLPYNLSRITTPLNHDAWQLWLNYHPDQQYASYILNGIIQGFRIGFNYNEAPLCSASSNHPCATEHPEVIIKALTTEINAHRLFGPYDPKLFPYVHTSSLGAVPKKHSEKWRLILDLSHPKLNSVNDGISPILLTRIHKG